MEEMFREKICSNCVKNICQNKIEIIRKNGTEISASCREFVCKTKRKRGQRKWVEDGLENQLQII